MHNFDVIIIGAGAAGLMCALAAGQRGRKVLLIDHNKKVGEKIRISGGGRCNFTNLHVTPKNFISQNPHFCVSALSRFGAQHFIKLLEKHNISYHEKTLGQLFCDYSSQQIIDMLLYECSIGGVTIALETKVKNIEKHADNFSLFIKNNDAKPLPERLSCQSLVIATGGFSIPKMGASGFGYDVARQFKLKIIDTNPALVPLVLDKSMLYETKNLSGVAVDANVYSFSSLENRAKTSFQESILFTHRGLSGPAILQISSYLKKDQEFFINMAPSHNIYNIFLNEKTQNPKQEIVTILNKYLPKSLASYIVSKHNYQGRIADIQNQKLKEVANFVNAWSLQNQGNEGYAKAEVTLGGVDTDAISSKTFECKTVPNLYFIGEVLDVTGHLGGFNFQWAWSSGHAAAQFV